MNLSRELDDNNCPLPPGGVHTETAKGLHSSGGGAGRGGGGSPSSLGPQQDVTLASVCIGHQTTGTRMSRGTVLRETGAVSPPASAAVPGITDKDFPPPFPEGRLRQKRTPSGAHLRFSAERLDQ